MLTVTPMNFSLRLDPATDYALEQLSARLGLSRSGLIRAAVRRWADSEGIEIPPDLPGLRAYPRRRMAPGSHD